MNKKIYFIPTIRVVDIKTEGMIASSLKVYEENIGEEFTQKKESDMWGNESIWK